MSRLIAAIALSLAAAGCAPLVGAGAVVAADEIAEEEGGNLF
ncbi:MAG: hypothetical protein ACU0BS_12905 [Hasllibacter sp.]